MTQTENKEFHKKEKINTSNSEHGKKIVKKHMTVRIPRGITEAIEDFLATEQAAKMGFDSKVGVVTTAVRRLLAEHGYYTQRKKEKEYAELPNRE